MAWRACHLLPPYLPSMPSLASHPLLGPCVLSSSQSICLEHWGVLSVRSANSTTFSKDCKDALMPLKLTSGIVTTAQHCAALALTVLQEQTGPQVLTPQYQGCNVSRVQDHTFEHFCELRPLSNASTSYCGAVMRRAKAVPCALLRHADLEISENRSSHDLLKPRGCDSSAYPS